MSAMEMDLFSEACIDTYSVPPWLDPKRVKRVSCDPWRDCDHVGENDIGRVGNDVMVWVVYVEDRQGVRLHARKFAQNEEDAAYRYMEELVEKIEANKQGRLGI